eukprot:jgi/Botrbrau1/22914/Bobra.0065s0063.1
MVIGMFGSCQPRAVPLGISPRAANSSLCLRRLGMAYNGYKRGSSRVSALTKKEGLDLQVRVQGDEVTLQFSVDIDTEREDVSCEIHPTRLSVSVKGEKVLEGHFPNECKADLDASWWTFNYCLPTGKSMVLVLGKEAHLLNRDPTLRDDWQYLFGNDPLPGSAFLHPDDAGDSKGADLPEPVAKGALGGEDPSERIPQDPSETQVEVSRGQEPAPGGQESSASQDENPDPLRQILLEFAKQERRGKALRRIAQMQMGSGLQDLMDQLWQDEWAAQAPRKRTFRDDTIEEFQVSDGMIEEARAFAERFSDSWRETHTDAIHNSIDSK